MASDQQFCLRWNNFQNNIISSFEYLRSEEDFVDVTLACEGRSLKAHKVILSACSQYFRDLLKTTPCQHPIIVLKDVCYEDLLSLMCFVYQGVVYIGQERLTQFLKTAEYLQIKGLSEHSMADTFGKSGQLHTSPSQSIPALTPIGVTTSAAPRPTSPLPMSSRSTPSPSPSFQESQPPPMQLAKRRKPLYPLQAFMPTQTSQLSSPAHSSSPGGPSQSSPTEEAATSGPVSSNGEHCQQVALSLVTETSILRQRIEGSSPLDTIKLENNGMISPCSNISEPTKLPTSLLLDHNSISMVGRETLGFPFLSQPGTSSLLSTTVSSAQDTQMMLNASASPRYRQRWRCMQPSVCPHCLRTFSNAFNLKQHIINVHTFGNELKCDVCGKVQKNKWYLRKHMVKSHNAPLRRVKLPDGTMVNTE